MRPLNRKLADSFCYPPRLMRATRAAAYLDISPSHFHKLVDDGALPKSLKLAGAVVWDRNALDAAADALSDAPEENSIDAMLRRK